MKKQYSLLYILNTEAYAISSQALDKHTLWPRREIRKNGQRRKEKSTKWAINRARDSQEISKLRAFYNYVKTNYPTIVTKYEAQRELSLFTLVTLLQPLLPCEGDADPQDHVIHLLILENVEALFKGKLFEDFNFEEVFNSEE